MTMERHYANLLDNQAMRLAEHRSICMTNARTAMSVKARSAYVQLARRANLQAILARQRADMLRIQDEAYNG